MLLRRTRPARGRALPGNVERAVRRMSAAGIVLACGTLLSMGSSRRALAEMIGEAELEAAQIVREVGAEQVLADRH